MSGSENEDEIEPSVLGTKEFWDKHYGRELNCFSEAEETQQQIDVGNECWFDRRIVRAVTKYLSENVSDRNKSLIDIGCGNGALLRELADIGFTDLNGVDYSETGIELAKRSAATKEKWSSGIRGLFCADLCSPLDKDCDALKKCYAIGVDVGTYDAITLRPPDESDIEAHRKRVDAFVKNVTEFVSERLILASCNWTTQELTQTWTASGEFRFLIELPTPTFRFGSREGHTVTCAVFEKINKK